MSTQLTLTNYRQLVETELTQVLRLAFLRRGTVADLAALAADVVAITGGGTLTWRAVISAICKAPSQTLKGVICEKTAARRLAEMVKFSLISKDENGQYHVPERTTDN